ncbi:MAG: hypothetical protein U0359_01600 [Byssovorax sp.]
MDRTTFTIDPPSRLLVHTRAEGLLARLAHDLELSSKEISGTASLDGDAWTAELDVPVRSLTVEGVLRGDVVDHAALSGGDREQILSKMREDVFGTTTNVEARAQGSRRDRGEAIIACGRASMRAPITLSVKGREGGALHASGSFEVSIKALGGKPVKGPLGAFAVKDRVTIRFALTLIPG